MDNKFYKALQEFLKDQGVQDLDEANEKLQEFIEKYNNGEIEYENTPLDEAYELLDKAGHAKSEKEAIRLAKQAYKKSSACFDAILFQADLAEPGIKRMKLLEKGLDFEKKRLEEEKFFEEDNIGDFYGLFETRPYIRGLVAKVRYFLEAGKFRQAEGVCKEILRLNKNDNMGVRYLLMAIYAVLEEEDNMLELYKKYPEENLEMLFPLFALYYKLGNDKKAKQYLEKVNKSNPYFAKAFDGTLEESDEYVPGYYRMGESSEVFMYFEKYLFLLILMPELREYVMENLKK